MAKPVKKVKIPLGRILVGIMIVIAATGLMISRASGDPTQPQTIGELKVQMQGVVADNQAFLNQWGPWEQQQEASFNVEVAKNNHRIDDALKLLPTNTCIPSQPDLPAPPAMKPLVTITISPAQGNDQDKPSDQQLKQLVDMKATLSANKQAITDNDNARDAYLAAQGDRLTFYLDEAVNKPDHCYHPAFSPVPYSSYYDYAGGGSVAWGTGSLTPDQGILHSIIGSTGRLGTANAVPTPAPPPGLVTPPASGSSGSTGGNTGGSDGSTGGNTGGGGGTTTTPYVNPPQRNPGGG